MTSLNLFLDQDQDLVLDHDIDNDIQCVISLRVHAVTLLLLLSLRMCRSKLLVIKKNNIVGIQ